MNPGSNQEEIMEQILLRKYNDMEREYENTIMDVLEGSGMIIEEEEESIRDMAKRLQEEKESGAVKYDAVEDEDEHIELHPSLKNKQASSGARGAGVDVSKLLSLPPPEGGFDKRTETSLEDLLREVIKFDQE